MRVILAGGGIGGLSAALALRRADIDVLVLEREPEAREAGAAITLWSNALRAAQSLGVSAALQAAGDEVIAGQIRSSDGTILMETPVADIGRRLGAPSVCLSRSALLDILRAALPEGTLRYGAPVAGFQPEADGLAVLLEGAEPVRGDVLVGCDGIRSAVRSRLFRPEEPRYAGHLCFRAMTDFRHRSLPLGISFESWGVGDSFGLVPMRGERVYWFANVSAPEGMRFGEVKPGLLARYGGWHEPIRALIEATPDAAILCHEVYDRDPVDAWGRGRVTLLGDAAHPATPDLGQGGCLAMEDAVVLAACLRGTPDPVRALREYEELRRPRANRLTKKSRWFGWIGHQKSGFLCAVRNLCVRATPAFLLERDYVKIVDYDAAGARSSR